MVIRVHAVKLLRHRVVGPFDRVRLHDGGRGRIAADSLRQHGVEAVDDGFHRQRFGQAEIHRFAFALITERKRQRKRQIHMRMKAERVPYGQLRTLERA